MLLQSWEKTSVAKLKWSLSALRNGQRLGANYQKIKPPYCKTHRQVQNWVLHLAESWNLAWDGSAFFSPCPEQWLPGTLQVGKADWQAMRTISESLRLWSVGLGDGKGIIILRNSLNCCENSCFLDPTRCSWGPGDTHLFAREAREAQWHKCPNAQCLCSKMLYLLQ